MIAKQLPEVTREQILSEPAARNTAPACALAAFLLERTEPDTVIGIFPSDHVVKNTGAVCRGASRRGGSWRRAARTSWCWAFRRRGRRPATDISSWASGGPAWRGAATIAARRVKRFTEKPRPAQAERFWRRGTMPGTAGYFCGARGRWRMRSARHRRRWRRCWRRLLRRMGRRSLRGCLRSCIRSARTSAIDYAVLEPRSAKGEAKSEIYCLPADFGWNDLGSWAALHEHRGDGAPENCGGATRRTWSRPRIVWRSMRRAIMFMRRARRWRCVGVEDWSWWRRTMRC